jgi:hypothetical protein
MKNLSIFLLFVFFFSTTISFAGKKDIDKKEYPKEWCFKPNSGYITCSNGNLFFVIHKGKTFTMYGMNGSAKTFSKEKGKFRKGYADIEKILLKDKKTKTYKGDFSFFLNMGKKLC